MDSLKELLIYLISNYGVFTTIVLGMILILLYVFSGKIIEKVKNFILNIVSVETLFKHNPEKFNKQFLFLKLNYLLNVRIQSINCSCELRKYMFKKIFSLKIKMFLDALSKFMLQEHVDDDKYSYKVKLCTLLRKSHNEWRQACLQQGMPVFIMNQVEEEISPNRQMFYTNLNTIFSNGYLYSNNEQRFVAVLDMFISLQETILNTCQEVLDTFNGQVKGLQFNGVKCNQCKVCVHDLYLQNRKID